MAKLYYYYSAMNAGKSTTLLQSCYNYEERGMDTLLFAPAIDTRFESPTIYSRIGIQRDALPYSDTTELFEEASEAKVELPNLRCILIDEAQFLTKSQVQQLVRIVTELNVAVLAYGLRSDFLGEPFPGSSYLLAWAHEIVEIKTICHCGSKATMNMRKDETGTPVTQGDQVQIGGNDTYVSLCLKHYAEAVPVFGNATMRNS